MTIGETFLIAVLAFIIGFVVGCVILVAVAIHEDKLKRASTLENNVNSGENTFDVRV